MPPRAPAKPKKPAPAKPKKPAKPAPKKPAPKKKKPAKNGQAAMASVSYDEEE